MNIWPLEFVTRNAIEREGKFLELNSLFAKYDQIPTSDLQMFNFTGYKSQIELLCIALGTRRTERIYIEFYCLTTDDELSLDHKQHFICISYTKSLNLHHQLDARAALTS